MRRQIHIKFTIGIFITLIFILGFLQNIHFSSAQSNGETLTLLSSFEMMEFSEKTESNKSISSIEISLPSETWNITNLELNFSDIRLGKEIKTIEDKGGEQDIKTISWRDYRGFAVQINITVPTIIFGVYLSGYVLGDPKLPLYVQIQGYDIDNDIPDENILGNSYLNILPEDNTTWHIQTFDDEVSLSPGQYFLVINGSELDTPFDKTEYNIFNNESGSTNGNLYTSKFDGAQWSVEDIGKPLLYKLIQRVNTSFGPEEINMTAEIKGDYYPILNGTTLGTGFLTLNDTIVPSTDLFNIPIKNSRVAEIIFNLSYSVKLQNSFFSEGNVLIQEDLENTWTLSPNINRFYSNYSVKFYYPSSWEILMVKKNNIDISLNVSIDPFNKFVFIPNNIITVDSSWEIIASSPNVVFDVNLPVLEWEPGQELQFTVNAPIAEGNLTFFLINPLGFGYEEPIEIKEVTSDEILFSYIIPSNSRKGSYIVKMYWNNATDAGVQTQVFTIVIPFVLDPMLIVIIVGSIAIVSIAVFTTYKVINNLKRKHEAYREAIFNKYIDVLNLEYFIIIHKKSGLNVYEQILASKTIDPSLISGFLEAIRTFGIELTSADKQSQTIKLDYQQSKILMSEFKSFRILLIMKENPSHDFLESIKELSYDIDNKYGNLIESFKGNLRNFTGIKDLLEQHLQTSLIYPLQIVKKDVKLKSDEKSIVNRAKTIMKRNNMDYFIVTNLLSVRKEFDAKDAEIILNLIKKKIFQPKI